MRRNNNGSKPPDRVRSNREKYKIRKWYADNAAKNRAGQATVINSRSNDQSERATPQSAVGKVYRGETKYIDKEPKKQRNYVVVRDSPRGVSVAKLKSIKQLDKNGRNADKALVEINHERYGLPSRTGVDFQRFDKNLMSGKLLDLEDKDVFPEDKERFTLSNRDRDKAVYHTGVKKRKKPKK